MPLFTQHIVSMALNALLLCVGLFASSIALSADVAAPLPLSSTDRVIDPTAHLTYQLDPSARLRVAHYPANATDFTPVQSREANFGYQSGYVWLALPMHNTEQEPLEYVAAFGLNFIDELDAFWVDAAGSAHLMHTNSQQPFAARPVAYHELTLPLNLPPGAQGALLIRYASNGGTTLPLRLYRPDAWAQQSRDRTSYLVASYTLLLAFALIGLIAFLAVPSRRIFLYVVQMLFVVTYIAHVDGFGFERLWPNAPGFNQVATPLLAAATTFTYCLFCWAYLDMPKLYPRLNRWFLAFLGLQLASIVLAYQHVVFAVVGTSISAVIITGVAIYAVIKEGRDQLLFLIGRIGYVAGALAVGARELFNAPINYHDSIEVIRYAAIWEGAALGLALIFFYRRLIIQRQDVQTRHIQALQSNLEMQNRFRQLETRAELASQIAESRSQQLADATHDLRQPLYSLRLAIRDLMDKKELDTQSLESVANNFTYLESLVNQYLDSGLETIDEASTPPAQDDAPTGFPLRLVLNAVSEMFTAEAEERGITLHVMDSRSMGATNPTAVLRIVNNFVGNAIKYCRPGDQVLIGVRRFNGKRFITVYDTGPGISDAERERVEQRLQRGNEADRNPEGKGLGLSIVSALAEEHRLEWLVRSTPGRGSLFAIQVAGNLIDPHH